MAVHIDETGQHIHARGIDHALGALGFAIGRTAGVKRGDAIAFDHDVHRTCGRGAAAFDNRRAADQQLAERAFAFVRCTVGHTLHLGSERLQAHGGQCGECDFPDFHVSPTFGPVG